MKKLPLGRHFLFFSSFPGFPFKHVRAKKCIYIDMQERKKMLKQRISLKSELIAPLWDSLAKHLTLYERMKRGWFLLVITKTLRAS